MILEELESIISKNMTITDEQLYEAVMSTALDVEKATQAAERERIKQIIDEVGRQGNHDKWFDCADAIAGRIEE